MAPAPLPTNEVARLAALQSYDVLDSRSQASFDKIVELAAKLTGSPMASIALVGAERQWFKARHGLDAAETLRDHSFCAHAILSAGEPLIVPDATRDPRFVDNPLVIGPPGIRFYAGAPLVNPEGLALGALCVMDTKPREIGQDHRDTLLKLGEIAMSTLELRRTLTQVYQLAMADPLTGLYNLTAFYQALDRTIARQQRHGEPFGVLYLDLDGLKQVNDTHGHTTGDAVLWEVANTMTAWVRSEDVVARIGGDEFAVLLAGGPVQAEPAAERVRAKVQERMKRAGWNVTASIGAVTFKMPPKNAAEAIAAADQQMCSAKSAGKNRVAHREIRAELTASLRQAADVPSPATVS
jgi:diguanylate cyclase (GGDEF)-like protein